MSKTEQRNSDDMKVVNIVALVTGLSLLGDSMLYIALPIYWEEVGLDSFWQIGILLSINRFVRLPVNPLVGWVYNRISIKSGLLIAIIIGTVTTLGYGFLKGFIAWVILRALWGIGWSFFRIGGLATVAYYADDNKLGKAMGTYNGISRLGSLVGILFGGIFVPLIGLDKVAIIFGIATSLGIPLIVMTLRKDYLSKMSEAKEKTASYLAENSFFEKYKFFSICLSGLLLAMLFQGVLMSTLSSVIEHFYGKEVNFLNIAISAALLSGIIQSIRWLWEPFLGRWIGQVTDGPIGRKPILIFSLLYAGSIYWLISLDLPVIIWVIITLGVLTGVTIISTVSDALSLDIAKNSSNTVSRLTVYSISQDFGAALGPFISYLVIELVHGYSYLYVGGTIILFLLALQWLIVTIVEKKHGKHALNRIAK